MFAIAGVPNRNKMYRTSVTSDLERLFMPCSQKQSVHRTLRFVDLHLDSRTVQAMFLIRTDFSEGSIVFCFKQSFFVRKYAFFIFLSIEMFTASNDTKIIQLSG